MGAKGAEKFTNLLIGCWFIEACVNTCREHHFQLNLNRIVNNLSVAGKEVDISSKLGTRTRNISTVENEMAVAMK